MNSLRAHASNAATTLRVLGGAGVIRPYGPRTLVALGRTEGALAGRVAWQAPTEADA